MGSPGIAFTQHVLTKMKISSRNREQKFSAAAKAEAGPSLSPRTTGIVAVALAAIVFAIYSSALNFQFVLDDHRFVGDPRIQWPGHVWEYFTSYVWAQVAGGPASFYRPLFVLWLRLNFILSGESPWGWHLLSIMKHLTVAALLALLVWKLLRDRVAALLAGTLFALHPAQVESVAWVTVPDPVMSAAILGSLLLYLKYSEPSSADQSVIGRSLKKSRRRRPAENSSLWIAGSAALCLAALLTKETAIVLPAIIFAVTLTAPPAKASNEDMAKARNEALRLRAVSALRWTLPFLGATGIYLLLRVSALNGQLSPRTQHLPWSTLLLSWPATLWFYVKVLLWPVQPRAFADPTIADSFSLHAVLLPGLGVLCAATVLTAVCGWAWQKARHDLSQPEAVRIQLALLIGSLLLVLPLLLTLNLNSLDPGDFLHGRYTYLPLAGLMLVLSAAYHLAGRGRILLLCAVGLLAAAFAGFTVQQEAMWKDDLTIFTVAHQYAPHNQPVARNLTKAHVQAALELDEEGQCDQAMPIFEQAIEQFPEDWFAWAGRGECLFKLGDLPKAEQSLRRASELSHEPRVTEEWQQVRAQMGLPSTPPR
ncbi:MAG TPA: tetratricopeptide repeat protein [Candidatus Sulfotelmatobacter sp.]|jgi:VanZ family protein